MSPAVCHCRHGCQHRPLRIKHRRPSTIDASIADRCSIVTGHHASIIDHQPSWIMDPRSSIPDPRS
eukprot:2942583-Rhodomonas_salina.2